MCKVENFSWEDFVVEGNFFTTSDGNIISFRYKSIYINKISSQILINSQAPEDLPLVLFLNKHKVLLKSILEAYLYGFWKLDFYRNLSFKGEHKKAIQLAFQIGKRV